MNIISKTKSLCPECVKFLDATIFERDGKVWIKKDCPEHGEFEELYWGNYEMYNRAKKWAKDGKDIENPFIKKSKEKIECPKDCGLCKEHKSFTALGNIVVTTRCDLACWYCFFYAQKMGYVYEPTQDQIRTMLRNMKNEKPRGCSAIQFTGGEPTFRKDIVDILKIAKEEGYNHIQLNTNGIRLSQDLEFAKKVRAAGVNTLYMSFDGTTPKTNPKNHWEVPGVMDSCKKTGMGLVLVPTVIKGINDHDVGNILKFGLNNIDVVHGVNYQPVSLVGRISKADRTKMRITIPDVIEKLVETGMVEKEDFFPIPIASSLSRFAGAVTGKIKYDLTAHFACGMATYLIKDDDGKIVPLPRFLDVEGFTEYLEEKTEEIMSGKSKLLTSLKLLAKLNSFVDKDKQPKCISMSSVFKDIMAKKASYRSFADFHHKSLMIGMMHFMDLYNYDIERVKRCCIHYAQPDGSIIPFCAFNVIPQWYRDVSQKKFSTPVSEWEKQHGRKLDDDVYKRDVKKLEADPRYKKTYKGFI